LKIEKLKIYPIKGCKGISLEIAEMTNRGLRHDREWIIVDVDSKHMITQREIPSLSLLHVELDSIGQGKSPSKITIWKSGDEDKFVLGLDSGSYSSKERIQIQVWKSSGEGYDEGDQVSDWLSKKFLGESAHPRRLRLLRFCDDFSRKVRFDIVNLYEIKSVD
jgi:uncharacterized protein